MDNSIPSKNLIKTKPIKLPIKTKILLELKEEFQEAEIDSKILLESLQDEGDKYDEKRRYVYDRIRYYTQRCQKCTLPLLEQHTQKVPGYGCINAPLMLIGEGPGFEEDKEGRPFVGKAGKLLTTILDKLEISRERLYITNVIKCRPPNNRTPSKEETDKCSEILQAELGIVSPKVILALGAIPLKYFGISGGITRARGKWVKIDDFFVMPTYHPAYILRQQGKALVDTKWEVWHDFNAALDKTRELKPSYSFEIN